MKKIVKKVISAIKKIRIIRFKQGNNDNLLDLYIRSITNPVINKVQMPGFPSEDIQRQFVGSSYEQALREGFKFYIHVKNCCEKFSKPINKTTKLIDFGCGWGRIIRFFFQDISNENIFGVDVDPKMVNFNNENMHYGHYLVSKPQPPLAFFENKSIDVIFAYSVFSHLAEDTATKWINEFNRILKPGGLLLATTQGRGFLDYCDSLKEKDLEFSWHRTISKAFFPTDKFKKKYDNGEFVFAATGGGDIRTSDFYGEALIPKQFIEKNWTRDFNLCDFFYDTNRLPQAFFALKKIK